MAYKRKSPMPIIEGGTNATSFSTTDGVVYYDGTKLNNTAAGTSSQALTSNGAAMAPTFQNISSGGGAVTICGIGGESNPVTGVFKLAFGNTNPPYEDFAIQGCIVNSINTGGALAFYFNNYIAVSGTAANLYVYVYSNTSTNNVAVTIYKNSVATALTVTITALTTGTFSNTINTAAFIASTDLIEIGIGPCNNGGTIYGTVSCTYTT